VCGLAGIFGSTEAPDALAAKGADMVTLLAHRGPDDAGSEVIPVGPQRSLVLGLARLKIVDLTSAGHQPMFSADRSLAIAFNGEIYNFRELRAELETSGARFNSSTDTEVILQAYRRWGMDCFDRFIGMWGLALWDAAKDRLILSRDRMGIKPLFYARDGDVLAFASEPKAVLSALNMDRRLDLTALSDYLSYRHTLGERTFYRGVLSLEPGCHLVIEGGNQSIQRYWELPIIGDKHDPGEEAALAGFSELFESSVRHRMVADVPVGAFLSGGLDSSAVVATMATMASGQIKTFTIGYPGHEGYNEFGYARQVVQACDTDHQEVTLNGRDIIDLVPKLVGYKDAPLAATHEVALFVLSRELRKQVTVVLSGEGADELLGGYGRIFRSAYDVQRLASGRPDGALAENLKAKYGEHMVADPLDHFLTQYTYTPLAQKRALLTQNAMEVIGPDLLNRTFFETSFNRLQGLDLHESYMWVFQTSHLLGLLGRLDSATMATSVEGRVPFVDHRLVEYVNALPLHYKLRWKSGQHEAAARSLNSDQISETHDVPKYLLKKAFSDGRLPSEVIDRRKMGFPVPLGHWLGEELGDYTRELLLDPSAKTRDVFGSNVVREWMRRGEGSDSGLAVSLWMLMNVEAWMRECRVGL
jgi:asparagine synthase (glutamine-hydrolysing)